MNDKEIYMLGETYDRQTPVQAGYWFSEDTGNWYEKSKPRKSEFIKDTMVYNWSLVTDEKDISDLNDGIVPHYEPCGYDLVDHSQD